MQFTIPKREREKNISFVETCALYYLPLYLNIFRLNNSESLFLRRNDKNLKPYGFEEYLCSCGEYSTVGQEELANNVLCYSSKVKICKDSNFEVTNLQAEQCSVSGKNKSRGPVDKHSDSATSVENGGPNTMATSSPLVRILLTLQTF